MSKLTIASILFVVAIASFGITQSVSAQNAVNGYQRGIAVGTAGAAVSQTLNTDDADKLSFILTATGGNFGSKFGLVSVSTDGSTFILVDNISLSTNTKLAKNYSDDSLASTVAVNPAMYPFVKIETSAGNTAVTEKISYVVQRD